MLFSDMLEVCKKMTPAQLHTEVCGFEGTKFAFWVDEVTMGEDDNRPFLNGTCDIGHECATDCSACQPALMGSDICDECDGSGTYLIDGQPRACICSEPQE